MADEMTQARRERASENNFLKQRAERLYEGGQLDLDEQLFVMDLLLKERGLEAFG